MLVSDIFDTSPPSSSTRVPYRKCWFCGDDPPDHPGRHCKMNPKNGVAHQQHRIAQLRATTPPGQEGLVRDDVSGPPCGQVRTLGGSQPPPCGVDASVVLAIVRDFMSTTATGTEGAFAAKEIYARISEALAAGERLLRPEQQQWFDRKSFFQN